MPGGKRSCAPDPPLLECLPRPKQEKAVLRIITANYADVAVFAFQRTRIWPVAVVFE